MSMGGATIKIVCFDLGGVVLRICRTWAEGCAAAGLEVRDGVDPLGAPSVDWLELDDLFQKGKLDGKTYFQRISDLLGGVYRPDEVMRVHDAWTLEEYEGIDQLVQRLHEARVETAVLSNTSHEHWVKFGRYPAFARLRNRHGSHELGLRKPDKAIYQALEERIGFTGGEIIFFDDLPENVAAAREVGWHAHSVDPFGQPAERIAGVLEGLGVL